MTARGATWAVVGLVVLVIGVGALAVLFRPESPIEPRRPIAGFDEVAFQVTTSSGEVLDWCALLAATEAARRRGLSGQDDLDGYDAMVFRYEQPTSGPFWMFRTTLPLSIAWFDGGGRFVSSADMDPCPSEDPGGCRQYSAAGPYQTALEAAQGDLDQLGAGPGSTVTVGGACA